MPLERVTSDRRRQTLLLHIAEHYRTRAAVVSQETDEVEKISYRISQSLGQQATEAYADLKSARENILKLRKKRQKFQETNHDQAAMIRPLLNAHSDFVQHYVKILPEEEPRTAQEIRVYYGHIFEMNHHTPSLDVYAMGEMTLERIKTAEEQGMPVFKVPTVKQLEQALEALEAELTSIQTTRDDRLEYKKALVEARKVADLTLKDVVAEVRFQLRRQPAKYIRLTLRGLGFKYENPPSEKRRRSANARQPE